MNHPLSAVAPVARVRVAVDSHPPATSDRGSQGDFAPQLARACERGLPSSSNILARNELSPVSDLTGGSLLRPGEPPALAEHVPAEQRGDADPDTSDEDQWRPDEEELAGVALTPEPIANAALVTLTPLALLLAQRTGATTEGKAAAGAPEMPTDTAGQETIIPGSSRAGSAAQPTAKPGDPASVAGSPPAPVAPAAHAQLAEASRASSAETAPAPPLPAGGTSVASLNSQMNMAQDMNKTSGQEEQNLPPAPATAPWLAEQAGPRALSASHTSTSGDTASALAAFVQPATEAGRATEPVAHVAPVDPTAKVLALMAGAVVQFRQTGADDFEVSLQPDPDTEIRLRVSLGISGVEMQAELRRGDAAALAARWPDLQERLAQQGIKLAALTEGDASSGGFGQDSGFASPRQQPEAEGEAAPFATTTTTAHPNPAAPTRPSHARGWETWA